jgi:hypothetical protein
MVIYDPLCPICRQLDYEGPCPAMPKTQVERDLSVFHRTNINLFMSDVEWLENKWGRGWTESVRDIVHQYVLAKQDQTSVEQHRRLDPEDTQR